MTFKIKATPLQRSFNQHADEEIRLYLCGKIQTLKGGKAKSKQQTKKSESAPNDGGALFLKEQLPNKSNKRQALQHFFCSEGGLFFCIKSKFHALFSFTAKRQIIC